MFLKGIRSLVCLILAFVLVPSNLVFSTNAQSLSAEEPTQSFGVYQVSTVEHLLWAAEHPDKHYVLVKDINIPQTDWTPIGTEAEPFSGTFNGSGHSITISIEQNILDSGIYLVGLFGYITGTVMNLTVNGSIEASISSGYVGGVAANLSGGKITGCESNVDITAEGASSIIHVGGIVGAVRSLNGSGTIENCVNNGDINVKALNITGVGGDLGSGTRGSVGGILGLVCDTSGAYITSCINNGHITVTGGADNVGGIVGQTSVNTAATFANITYCANKGDITGYRTEGERSAGIIGYIKRGVINFCYNLGNVIEYTDDGSTVARQGYGNFYGIFGYANLSSSNTLEVTYCYNASENPLEAEICVVRNASHGTFKNFYMEGRSEYETELNAANVSTGVPGTAFSSPSDLYEKITATEEGARAYAANPTGGYPILYFEKENVIENDNSGFIEIEPAGSLRHNLYFVFRSSHPADRLQITATLEGGSSALLEKELVESGRVKVADKTYVAADGAKLYTAAMHSIPDDVWTAAKITAKFDGNTVFTTTLNADDVIDKTGVEIPIEGLPNYPDGVVSQIYNCGPGLANDQQSVTDEDSKMVVVSSTNEESFINYINRLTNIGFNVISHSGIDGNIHYGLQNGQKFYYIYYTAYSKQTRIIEDNSTNVLLSELDSEIGDSNTEFYLYSIDYTHGEGQTTKTDYWQIDCGALMVIKLADNSLFIIDGGHERQSSNAALEAFLDFAYDITGKEPGTTIDIKGWYFTHAHGDHVYFAHAFVKKYHEYLNIQATYFNIPSFQTMPNGYDAGTFLMKDTFNKHFPDCKHVKLHTGQRFSLQGVGFEVLLTHEDMVNESGTTSISNFNDSSTIIRITIDGKSFMILGDTDTLGQSTILKMYKNDTLKSDAVQVSHHGYNDLPQLYAAIAAPLALFPNSEENAGENSGNRNKYLGVINAAENATPLFADPNTYKIYVEDGELKYETLPSYREGLYFTIPDLDESLIPVSEEPHVDLDEVLKYISFSEYVIDKSANGTEAIANNETCSLILDGKTTTKFCTSTKPAVIAWKMKQPVKVFSYVIYTANDNSRFTGRNPQKWVLCGSNDAENWNVIDAVYAANLPDVDYTGFAFKVDNPAEYQYYVLKIFSAAGAGVLQLSEIELYSDVPKPAYIPGDLNGDGRVTVTDIVGLRGIIMNNEEPEKQVFDAGDLNKDGRLTVTDIVAIRGLIMNQDS